VRVDRCGRAAGLVAAHEPAAIVNAGSHSSESNYLHHSRRNLLRGWIFPCGLGPWRPRAAHRSRPTYGARPFDGNDDITRDPTGTRWWASGGRIVVSGRYLAGRPADSALTPVGCNRSTGAGF
jgi:hypothetical protein